MFLAFSFLFLGCLHADDVAAGIDGFWSLHQPAMNCV